jgi:hypothetical protein
MRNEIQASIAAKLASPAVKDVLDSFEKMVTWYRKGAATDVLTEAGKFVENGLRLLEFVRTGATPTEIKNASATAKDLDAAKTLDESIRVLIPRILLAMIYDVRSKKGAVHVKGIDPTVIDATLAINAASWVVAELLRLFHTAEEKRIVEIMASLSRRPLSCIEYFGEERLVTKDLGADGEVLMLLASSEPSGLSRREIGEAAQFASQRVSDSVARLVQKRQIYLQRTTKRYRITGEGELELEVALAKQGASWRG